MTTVRITSDPMLAATSKPGQPQSFTHGGDDDDRGVVTVSYLEKDGEKRVRGKMLCWSSRFEAGGMSQIRAPNQNVTSNSLVQHTTRHSARSFRECKQVHFFLKRERDPTVALVNFYTTTRSQLHHRVFLG